MNQVQNNKKHLSTLNYMQSSDLIISDKFSRSNKLEKIKYSNQAVFVAAYKTPMVLNNEKVLDLVSDSQNDEIYNRKQQNILPKITLNERKNSIQRNIGKLNVSEQKSKCQLKRIYKSFYMRNSQVNNKNEIKKLSKKELRKNMNLLILKRSKKNSEQNNDNMKRINSVQSKYIKQFLECSKPSSNAKNVNINHHFQKIIQYNNNIMAVRKNLKFFKDSQKQSTMIKFNNNKELEIKYMESENSEMDLHNINKSLDISNNQSKKFPKVKKYIESTMQDLFQDYQQELINTKINLKFQESRMAKIKSYFQKSTIYLHTKNNYQNINQNDQFRQVPKIYSDQFEISAWKQSDKNDH